MSEKYTPSEIELIVAWSDYRRNFLEYSGMSPEGVVERTQQAQRAIATLRAEAWNACVVYAPHTAHERKRLKEENPYVG